MTALLSRSTADSQRVALHIGECKKFGIEVLPPDLNRSEFSFKPLIEENKVLFGLDAVKNVNTGMVDKIIEERAIRPFANFVDFVDRMTVQGMNKKTVDNFVWGGACDIFNFSRRAMAESSGDIQKVVKKRIKDEEKGVMSLFATAAAEIVDVEEYEPKERLSLEKGALGVYISDHPLNNIIQLLNDTSITPIIDLYDNPDWTNIVGMITGTKPLKTKKGEAMAIFYLEDLNSKIEVVVFPRQMKQYGSLVKDDNIVKLSGRIDTRDEHGKYVVQSIVEIE
jgi:DNA polymerase-3 subunit alpha